MSIRRTAMSWEENYTTVPNEWVRDARLSRRARGLLVELLSHRPGWVVSLQSLTENGPEGRDALRSAIGELEDAGYLQRERVREDSGQLAGVDYILSDPAETPRSAPESDFPTQAEPTQAEPTHKKPIPTEDQSKKGPRTRGTSAPETFELTSDMENWALRVTRELGVEHFATSELHNVTQRFLAHHQAKGSTFKRWDRAWQTWVRGDAARRRKLSPAGVAAMNGQAAVPAAWR